MITEVDGLYDVNFKAGGVPIDRLDVPRLLKERGSKVTGTVSLEGCVIGTVVQMRWLNGKVGAIIDIPGYENYKPGTYKLCIDADFGCACMHKRSE